MSSVKSMRVAVVGATGLVGQTIARVLAERGFPVSDYVPVATELSGGRSVAVFDRAWTVRGAADVDFEGVDVCFFTAGATVSREWVPKALAGGCRVVDNTTAFRMDPGVPLVVPEINGKEVTDDTRLVSCPNCTAIVLVMTLAPLMREVELKRVVVTSLQSVSGAGREALTELEAQTGTELDGGTAIATVFPKPIAFNCIPRIGDIDEAGFSTEEQKIAAETRKILEAPRLDVVSTAVRVPVKVGHAVAVNVEFADDLSPERAMKLWREAPGVAFDEGLPTQRDIAGIDTVVVGRVRRDRTRRFALSYWGVGDNLRKGAATNSVQIAELWAGP
jgi:aspartate-semialdehyde dehydrogenase